jgi:hypothetical protein
MGLRPGDIEWRRSASILCTTPSCECCVCNLVHLFHIVKVGIGDVSWDDRNEIRLQNLVLELHYLEGKSKDSVTLNSWDIICGEVNWFVSGSDFFSNIESEL